MTGRTAYQSLAHPPFDRDQFIADKVAGRLSSARSIITAAREDTQISSRMASRGYTAARMAGGLGMCRAAEAAFEDCQESLCSLRQAVSALERAEAAARQAYLEFQMISRLLFDDRAARAALGVEVEMQKDLHEFILVARASYEAAARSTVFHQLLAQYGSLEDACASLDELLAAHQVYLQARSAARLAVLRRDETTAQLDEWVRRFLYAAKTALRARPDLLKKLSI